MVQNWLSFASFSRGPGIVSGERVSVFLGTRKVHHRLIIVTGAPVPLPQELEIGLPYRFGITEYFPFRAVTPISP
jgi:hypothetical protein